MVYSTRCIPFITPHHTTTRFIARERMPRALACHHAHGRLHRCTICSSNLRTSHDSRTMHASTCAPTLKKKTAARIDPGHKNKLSHDITSIGLRVPTVEKGSPRRCDNFQQLVRTLYLSRPHLALIVQRFW